MRHASIDQLLSIRDREPVEAGAASHVSGCERCQRDIADLERRRQDLRELPALEAPAGLWQRVAEEAGLAQPPQSPWYLGGVGLAATVVMAVALFALDPTSVRPEGPTIPVAQTVSPLAGTELSPVGEASTSNLMARSRELERSLRSVDLRGKVVSGRSAATMAMLEDRIAMIDYQLGRGDALGLTADQQNRLWRQRVALMNALVRLRFAEAGRTDF